MVYVSKKPLKPVILARISELLIVHIANIKTKENSKKFINEILTDAEKKMFAKRLAIIAMLNRKQSYSSIMNTLKVSRETIAKTSTDLKNGEYDFIISQLNKVSNNNSASGDSNFSIWLDIMLGMRIPPRGKGRWKFLEEIEQKRKK